MTITISTTYTLEWYIPDTDYYFTKCGRCFNVKRSKEVRRILNGGSAGFTINGKFESLKSIRSKLIKIEEVVCPF